MSGIEGTSVPPPSQLHLSPTAILRPPSYRHFPFSPIPPSTFDPSFFLGTLGKSNIKAPAIDSPESKHQQTIHNSGTDVPAADIHPKEEMDTHALPPDLTTGLKRRKKPKSSSLKKELQPSPVPIDGSPSSTLAPSSCRYDSSLGLLTKRFINLLKQAEDGTLDLNSTADILEVQKRRIYDITNVLEGVGVIEKKLKNRICWKEIDMSRPREQEDQIAALRRDHETLHSEDCRLDDRIRTVQDNLRSFSEDVNKQTWLFVTNEDLNSLPCFKNSTLVAVKSPHGTSLEVPDPHQGIDFPVRRRYRILLRSATGPINCYLISNHFERCGDSTSTEPSVDVGLYVKTIYNDHGSRSVHMRDSGAVGNLRQSQDQSTNITPLVSLGSQESVGGFLKIVPSDVDMDADYWFLSDCEASGSHRWKT